MQRKTSKNPYDVLIPHVSSSAVGCDEMSAPQSGSKEVVTLSGSQDEDSYVYGTKVQFSCFPGYQLSGANETECLSNGKWSEEQPDCERKCYKILSRPVSGNFSIRFWRQYMSLFASIAAIVSLLLTSDRKKFALQPVRNWETFVA